MKTIVLSIALLFSLLTPVLFADSDTLPLNKKTQVIKESDSAGVTKKLWKGSGEKPEPIAGSEEATVPKLYLGSIGVFGTKKLNEVILKEELDPEFNEWIQKGLAGDQSSLELEKRLIQKIQKKYNFPFAEFSVVQFFEPDNFSVHIVLDVVEPADVALRNNFLPEPTEQFPDPDSLIKSWMEYENLSMDLVEAGEIIADGQKCTALHCPFGHDHAKLKKYGPIFTEGVKKNFARLSEILLKDKRPEFRSSAAFLLPYETDGKKIVPLLVDRSRDPDPIVRNNALRVLGEIAEFHPQFVIPVKPMIAALNHPRATDRSKSVYVVYMLAKNSSSAREEILREAIPNLLLLLETKVPDQKEFAYNTLKKVSGKEFPMSDVTSWKNWYAKLKKDKGLPAAK
jgi:hypothetical protein